MIPDPVQPIQAPLSSDEQAKILLPEDPWSKRMAWQIVSNDWAQAEQYRINAHDWRYRNSDELYLGYSGQRYWDGTRIPRSSLGVPVCFTQIESLLPKTVKAITDPSGFQFKSEIDLGDDEELILIAWREMVLKQLDDTGFREKIRRALKAKYTYGQGIVEVGFEEYEDETVIVSKTSTPRGMVMMNHPMAGPVPMPTSIDQKFSRKVTKETKLRPFVRYRSTKDIYVDPNCESPLINEAEWIFDRYYMTARAIKMLAKRPGFKIPNDEYLTALSHSKSTAQQDVTKQAAELYRYNQWNPAQDYTNDPSLKRIAVVVRTSPDRKVFWLQGGQGEESIIYNEPNKYGEINYFNSFYADVLDRWQALSVPDVIEGEQRLQQATINARIDELALAIHKPKYKRRGVTIPWYQLKTAPGRVIETEDPEKDIKTEEVDNITQQAYVEVNASQARTQEYIGLPSSIATGTPQAGGNSAQRSATGMNMLSSAAGDRIGYQVETDEDTFIEKIVTAIVRYDRKFMDLKTCANWLAIDPRFQKLDPVAVMNARIVVECRGSIKMAARMGFLQIFPTLAQTIFNPQFLTMMAQQTQQTLNAKSVFKTVEDALNYVPEEPWITQMTPQQIQQMNQPSPDAQMQMQMQQQQIQSDEGIESLRQQVKLLSDVIKESFQGHQAYAQMDDDVYKHTTQLKSDQRTADDDRRAAKNKKPS